MNTEKKLSGTERRKMILKASEMLISQQGYSAFGLRSVAKVVGIKLASLQYYFKTKDVLLRAVIDSVLERYIDVTNKKMLNAGGSPEQRMTAAIKWMLKDLRTPFTSSFFPQIWALASHDNYANEALDSMMVAYRKQVGVWISTINPVLSMEECERRGAILSALIEGTTLLIGHKKPHHPILEGVEDHICNLALTLAKKPPQTR